MLTEVPFRQSKNSTKIPNYFSAYLRLCFSDGVSRYFHDFQKDRIGNPRLEEKVMAGVIRVMALLRMSSNGREKRIA